MLDSFSNDHLIDSFSNRNLLIFDTGLINSILAQLNRETPEQIANRIYSSQQSPRRGKVPRDETSQFILDHLELMAK